MLGDRSATCKDSVMGQGKDSASCDSSNGRPATGSLFFEVVPLEGVGASLDVLSRLVSADQPDLE